MILYLYFLGIITSLIYNIHHIIDDGMFFLSDLPDHLMSILYPVVNLRPVTVFTFGLLVSIIILLIDYVKFYTNLYTNHQGKD